ncbi:hypothetical protein ACHQM5_019575 [Ranunculus cassubicifolius]
MFTSLRKAVLHKTNLFSSLNISPSSLIRIRFISTDSITTHHNSFTISYLINSCGLSQQKAISASNQVHFESSTNPDSVLTLFRDNGFSNSHISKIIAMYPILLIFKVDKTLKPKFDYFNSKGLSGPELTKVLCRNPNVMGSSLEKTIIPSINLLESIVGTREKVIAMLKRSMNVLPRIKTVESNIALLRSHGVPMSNIQKLLVTQPRVFSRNASRFSEKVEEVMKMKFDPSRQAFLAAIQVLSAMSRSSLDAKFCLYKSWGWSEDQVQCAFRKQPYCMTLSEENIMLTMDSFVNKFGYAPSSIAEQPIVLMFSCEKRIFPRCSAMQLLFKKGKVKQSTTLISFLQMPEDVFLKKYISRFYKEVPELLTVYPEEGKMNGLDISCSVV